MAYQAHGSLSFLLELGGDGFQPADAQRESVLGETYPGIKHFLALPISLQGHVYIRNRPKSDLGEDSDEEASATPATASIAVEGVGFTLGEQSYTTPSTGRTTSGFLLASMPCRSRRSAKRRSR